MKNALVLFLFLIGFGAIAQNDFGVWSGAEVKYNLSKKVEFGLECQMRFDNNSTRLNNTFVSPYGSYKLKKFLEIGLGYRWTNESDPGSFYGQTNTHRVTIDLEAKKIIDFIVKNSRWDLGFRLRSTHETGNGDRNSDYLRGQLELKYNVKGVKLEPFVSFEGFLHFNDQLVYTSDNVRGVHRVNKLRYRLGCKYEFMANQEVSLFYMIQDELENAKSEFVLGIGYTYKLSRK